LTLERFLFLKRPCCAQLRLFSFLFFSFSLPYLTREHPVYRRHASSWRVLSPLADGYRGVLRPFPLLLPLFPSLPTGGFTRSIWGFPPPCTLSSIFPGFLHSREERKFFSPFDLVMVCVHPSLFGSDFCPSRRCPPGVTSWSILC